MNSYLETLKLRPLIELVFIKPAAYDKGFDCVKGGEVAEEVEPPQRGQAQGGHQREQQVPNTVGHLYPDLWSDPDPKLCSHRIFFSMHIQILTRV